MMNNFFPWLIIYLIWISPIILTKRAICQNSPSERSPIKKPQNKKIHPFFEESLHYKIRYLGMTIGYIRMNTRLDRKRKILKAQVTISPLAFVKKVYYVGGSFGTHWNYADDKPIYAYEEVFQGKKYRKRTFAFHNGFFVFRNLKRRFSEFSLPHKKIVKEKLIKKRKKAPGFQDLLAAFYSLRSSGQKPKLGEIKTIKVLPAGNLRHLILRVYGEKEAKVPLLGKKKIFQVESVLKNPFKKGKTKKEDEDFFFQTKSHIYMWITNDTNFIPVKIWTKVPYLGTFYIYLTHYSQP